MALRSRIRGWLRTRPIVSLTRRALDETWSDSRTRSARDTRGPSRILAFVTFLIDVARVFGASAMAALIFEEPPLRNVGQDVKQAVRRLSRSPGFTVFSVGSLAAGLAATTAVCSLIAAAFLTPIAAPHLARLVNIESNKTSRNAFSWPEYLALKHADNVFTSVAASTPARLTLGGLGTGELVVAEVANGDYFNALGVGAEVGRVFQPSDDQPGAPPVLVLSDRTWRRQLASDPSIVGRVLTVSDVPFVVIGVAPSSFFGAALVAPTALWIPLSAVSVMPFLGSDPSRMWLNLEGWLKPGFTVNDASNVVALIGHNLDATMPIPAAPAGTTVSHARVEARQWSAMPTSQIYDTAADRNLATTAEGVMVLAGLVLLVACTNLANLALARGTGRRHEFAVRLALGASRWRLMRELLIENGCVTLLAVLPSLWLTRAGITWMADGFVDPTGSQMVITLPSTMSIAMFAGVGAVAAFAVAGLWPAWRLTRANVRSALSSDTDSNASLPRWRGRGRLIAAQVVCSTALVFLAVMLGEQIASVRVAQSGMRLDGLAVTRLTYPRRLRDDADVHRILDDLLRRARQEPGVQSAALVGGLGLGRPRVEGGEVTVPDRPFGTDDSVGENMMFVSVTPEAFNVLGIPTRQGRTFDARDTHDSPPTVVLSETAARKLFGTTDAVGRLVTFRHFGVDTRPNPIVSATIVGIVGDIHESAAMTGVGEALYLPSTQTPTEVLERVGVIARAERPARALAFLRLRAKDIDPELVVQSSLARTMWEGATITVLRMIGTLAAALGALALVLAMAGLYGVLSQMVLRRRREIGLRMALGADRLAVIRLVLADGLRPVWTGLCAGLVAGTVVRVAVRSAFPLNGPAVDLIALCVVPVPFVLAGLIACYLPARRASKVDPNIALREL